MNLKIIFQKAWHMLWNFRALWLFGAVLALVGADLLFPWPWSSLEKNDQWTKIKITDSATIQVPGVDATIDLSEPGGIRIFTPDDTSWRELNDLAGRLNRQEMIDLWPILIEFGLILACALLLGTVTRYIVETALIRMVNESEQTGRRLSVWEGLRRGFSVNAGRLFLLDLVVGVLSTLAFGVVFGLAVAPVLLAARSHEVLFITAGVSTFSLLILAGYLWLAASAMLSLVLQTIRRACVLEEQGLLASIRLGIRMTKQHLREAGSIWLAWMGIRLLWVPFGVLVLVLLAPALLLSVLSGAALSAAPAALVALVASQFLHGATPWIAGALAGLPIFLLVTISPFLFVCGLVEIYKSCLWTLVYRELRKSEEPGKATITLTVTTRTRYGTRPTEVGVSEP